MRIQGLINTPKWSPQKKREREYTGRERKRKHYGHTGVTYFSCFWRCSTSDLSKVGGRFVFLMRVKNWPCPKQEVRRRYSAFKLLHRLLGRGCCYLQAYIPSWAIRLELRPLRLSQVCVQWCAKTAPFDLKPAGVGKVRKTMLCKVICFVLDSQTQTEQQNVCLIFFF